MLSFIPFIPIILLLFLAALLTLIHSLRPDFGYSWLIAALGILIAWPLILLSNSGVPHSLPLVLWQPESLFFSSPELLIDGISWSFALALGTLTLAVILTDVVRAAEAEWSTWAGCLVLAAVGIVAVFAGNALTLLMAWAALDGIELIILLWHVPSSRAREQVVIAFSARSAGIFLVWLALLVAAPAGEGFSFDAIPQNISSLLILAAGLRLGVIPLHMPPLHERALRRNLGTMLRLVPAASSLMLLVRTASAGVPESQAGFLLAVVGIAAFISAFSWATAGDELEGRPFWILGMASLSLAAALRNQPAACLAWGLALLISGSILFLTSARHPSLLWISGLGLLGFCGLPFTPTWNSFTIYSGSFSFWLLFFPLAHALLLAGYARHALRRGQRLEGVERWVWAIYPLGLFSLPFAHLLIAWRGGTGSNITSGVSSWMQIIPSLVVLSLATLFWRLQLIKPDWVMAVGKVLTPSISFGWVYKVLWWSYRSVGKGVDFITRVMEGQAGVLWAFLLLTLLFAFLAQTGLGGR